MDDITDEIELTLKSLSMSVETLKDIWRENMWALNRPESKVVKTNEQQGQQLNGRSGGTDVKTEIKEAKKPRRWIRKMFRGYAYRSLFCGFKTCNRRKTVDHQIEESHRKNKQDDVGTVRKRQRQGQSLEIVGRKLASKVPRDYKEIEPNYQVEQNLMYDILMLQNKRVKRLEKLTGAFKFCPGKM